MKKLTLLLIVLLPAFAFTQTKYVTRAGHANLFSTTVAEDISADNYKVTSSIDASTGKMVFVVPVQSFEFKKALMQKHFNQENFMNSKEFPKIKFKGTIKNLSSVKWDSNGKYPVNVEGDITIRDVTKPLSAEGTIEVKDGVITASSVFMVKQITEFHVGKPTRKSKKNNVADDIKITYNGIYKVK